MINKPIYTVLLTIVFLFNIQACLAENIEQGSAQALDLQNALDLAMKNNHHIRSALATLPIAQASLIIAKYRPNPFFGTNNEAVKGGSLHPAELWQTFETGKKRHWRVQIAKEQISKTELEIAKMMWEIHTKVHVGYADLAIGHELYDLTSERVSFYKSLFNSAEKRFKAGDLSKLELERVKIQYLTVENELSELDGKLKKANVEFNHLLGNEVKEEATIKKAETLIPHSKLENYPGISDILGEAFSKRLEIAILEREYGIARAQLKKAKSDRIPNLLIGGGPVRPSYRDGIWGLFY
jgi:cobalt-zinc-cadmium efflux system outer membrane protein